MKHEDDDIDGLMKRTHVPYSRSEPDNAGWIVFGVVSACLLAGVVISLFMRAGGIHP